MPTATSGNTVQLVINVVDANSGEVIERTVRNVEMLGTAGTRAGQQMAEGMAQVSGSAAGAAAAVTKGADAEAQAVQRSAAAQQRAFREIGSAHAAMIAQTTRATGAGTPATSTRTPGQVGFRADAVVPPKRAVGEYVEMLENIAAAETKLTAQRMGVTEATVQGWKRAGAAWAEYERTVDRSSNVRRSAASNAVPAPPQRIASNPFTVGNTGAGTLSTGFTGGAVSELKQVSAAADEAGNHGEQAFKKIGGHAMTSLDNVRLLRDDLGIKIPRGMEMAISRSAVLSKVIGGIGSGLVALGAFELAFHVGKEIYDFYNKLTDVNAEMRKYAATANENASQKLFDTQSIEETNTLLRQTNGLMDDLDRKRATAGVGVDNSGGFLQYLKQIGGYINMSNAMAAGVKDVRPTTVYSNEDDKQRADLAAKKDLLNERKAAIDAKRAVDLQEAKATQDGMRLTGAPARAAARQNAEQLADLRQKQAQSAAIYQRDQIKSNNSLIRQQNPGQSDEALRDKGLQAVPEVANNLGEQDRLDARARAAGEFGAASVAAARKENDEIGQLRGQAQAAGLQGEARYRAQLQAAIDGFNRRVAEGELSGTAAHRMALLERQKYDAEYHERLRAEQAETARAQAEAATQGLTGLQRNDAERGARVADLDRQRPTFSDPGTYDARRSAIDQGSAAEATKLQQDFSDRIQQMDSSRSDSSMTANQRIAADTRRTVADISKTWNDLYGGLAENDARRVAGQASLNAEIGRINRSAADEVARNNRQVADETRKLQLEAGRGGGGNTFMQRSREVQADAEDRTRQIQEREDAAARAGELDNVRQFEAQKLAIQQIANNKELDIAREQRDKLAGELRGFFTNPLEAIKRQGAELASKAAADMLLGRKPGADGSGNGMGALLGGGGFGNLRSAVRPTFGRNKGLPAGRGAYEPVGEVLQAAPQNATVNAATATINVTSASINGGGFNAAGAPSSAVSSIASSGYAPTGNGSYFNLGNSPTSGGGSGEMGAPSSPGSSDGFSSLSGSVSGSGGGFSVNNSMGDAQQGISGIKSIGSSLGFFGKGGSSSSDGSNPFSSISFGGDSDSLGALTGSSDPFAAAGTSNPFSSGSSTEAGSGAAGAGGAAMGAIGGAMGVYSAFEGKGGVMGGLQGAISGAQLGASLGGPIGAAIGAVGGAVLGFMGHGARVQAQKYWWKELKPKIDAEMLGFEAGTADYQSVYDDLTKSDTEAKQKTREMGSGAVSYYNDTIHPGLQKDLQRLTREQKAGRQQFGMSAAQFHMGGPIGAFGSMATGDGQGWIHAQAGEFMLNQQAAMSHADVASLMNAGTSRADIAEYMGGNSPAPQRSAVSSGPTELHFHSPDARGAYQLFMDNKHHVRAALNASYAENSGGSD